MTDGLPKNEPVTYGLHEPTEEAARRRPLYPADAVTQHRTAAEDDGRPIPADPLHLCPNCEYILTGLTSRECPECGQSFRLFEARHQARDTNLELMAPQDVRALRRARNIGLIGLMLLGLSFMVPVAEARYPVLRAWFMGLFLVPTVVFVTMYKLYFQKTWSHAAMVCGLISAAMALMVMFSGC